MLQDRDLITKKTLINWFKHNEFRKQQLQQHHRRHREHMPKN